MASCTKSHFPDLEIPKSNILEYLFPEGIEKDPEPIWIDADNPDHCLSPKELLKHVKSTAAGLQRLGIRHEEVVSVFTPNHIFVPVVYLATVASGAIFTGFNPAYTVRELVHLIKDSQTKVMFVHPNLVSTAVEAARQAGLAKSCMFLFSEEDAVDSLSELTPWWTHFGNLEDAETWEYNKYSPIEASRTVATINYSSG